MKFTDTPQYKKGRLGEQFVGKYLEYNKYKVYTDFREESETADIMTMKDNNIAVFHVKTKPPFTKYPHLTGIDVDHFEQYLDVQIKNEADSFLVFVDEVNKYMYGIPLLTFDKHSYTMLKRFQVIAVAYLKPMIRLPQKLCDELALLSTGQNGRGNG